MGALPSGTVTFLFTDIEGSTTRWEQHPQAMAAALAHHDALLRSVIAAHGGAVFKMVGDACCAAFATAPAALAAALAAQRALGTEEWGALGPVRVRMALHTGAAEERDGDYFGQPLNRVARLLSTGHGGQMLLSLATQELVRDGLPPGVELRDLGEHRLKDLIRPEHIFQLVAPDLAADFAPLKTLDRRPANLPVQPTPLIGREREVTAVGALMRRADVHLATLTGPGGVGKTRLGLQVAAELLDAFADGVCFVALAPLSDPGLVASTIAQTLGVREAGGRSLVEGLHAHLHDKELLLVLDNFEQVVAAAPLVAELLAACPRLKVLVTSRAPLRLRGEHEYDVPPLALPDPRHLPPLERLTQYEAVHLFIARAQAVKADFAVTNENAPAVAEICHRLDGLPLAIELAAARVKILPPQALLGRLGRRLQVLTGGGRDLPARQQTLRGAIDWSYSLLDTGEQTLFGRLAVFVGGGTLEAVEAVCNAGADGECDVLDGVVSLVDKSLVRKVEGTDGEPRFGMLETIREYALEQLGASGEEQVIRRHHAEHYLAMAERADPELKGAQQEVWLERLEEEHDNLRAALRWVLDTRAGEPALRLGVALWWFWEVRGHLSEGRRWLAEALASPSGAAGTLRRQALNGAGALARLQGDHVAARASLEESLALSRELGDRWGIAAAFNNLGAVAHYQGDIVAARALWEESLALSRELGERRGIAAALSNLGAVAHYQGDHAARALQEESLALSRELGDTRGIAMSLVNLAEVVRDQGDYGAARTLLAESVALYRELGDRQGLAYGLEGLAGASATGAQAARMARLGGAAEVLREAIGAPLSPAERADYERQLAADRAHLDEAAWAAAWAEGRAMPLEGAIAFALDQNTPA